MHLLYEIIQEGLILPLFFFIGKAFADRQKVLAGEMTSEEAEKNRNNLANMIRTGLIIVFGAFTLLSLGVIIFADPLVRFMGQDVAIINETVTYIRLEAVANIFNALVRFVLVVLVTIKKDKYLYFMLILKMVLTVLGDTFLISSLAISVQMGVNGIAITNIIVNAFLFLLAILILYKEKLPLFKKERLSFVWTKGWAKIGGISGLESLVRNLFFMLMIVRMVNMVGEQGTFWVTNNFLWGWLLLPVLQLGELIKRDCGEHNKGAIKQKTLGYLTLTTIFAIIWLVSIPLWQPFFRGVLQLDNYQDIFIIALISVGFYVVFAFNHVVDSIFYGTGKTQYMLAQALITNIVYYGIAFILYLTGVFVPTLTGIALMFAIGMAFDAIVTFVLFGWMLKKKKISLIADIGTLEVGSVKSEQELEEVSDSSDN
ncbi:MAG: MATE family efflux transporter [Firmicutes bacterium]|nr:MATE family efflux transporter [Bacillota bacterium]